MTRPKILHVKGSAPFGGDCVLMLELGREAQRRGFDVDILATDAHFRDLIAQAGIGLVDLDVIRRQIRPAWDARGFVRLHAFLARSPYSIVHTHTSKPGVVATLAARKAGIPAILHTVHLLPFHEESGRLEAAAYAQVERFAARWCDRIVTVSDHQRDWALRKGIGTPEHVVSIPNGVPDDCARARRPRKEVRAELGLTDAFAILATGRLAPQKGLEYLIRAAPLLRARLPSAKILLAGSGPLESDLTQLALDLRVEDMTTFLGLRPDVGDLLAATDLVVLPSLWEGLSISLLEAMAAGKPIVTTRIGANLEVTDEGRGAVLVPAKDCRALLEAITTLAEDPPRMASLGRTAAGIQRERYTMRRMLDAYFEQYECILRRRAPEQPFPMPLEQAA